ncbi:uncharacterized protein CEXT_188201 [Caerostris extrusa]|uniref:Uncharacterized protein n=1 Tax=Caerostris extrusa TaxID=172846 RepID=A0AAV4TZD6_CAEEX|nr:uncharacterized protein CEXT_188201 [Caerostris extrusa]
MFHCAQFLSPKPLGFNACELEDTMAKTKSPNSLYQLCLKETAFLLIEKYWNRENTNPFSQINCNIVNDLFKFLLIDMDIEKPSPLKLLLKSGQLQNLVLYGHIFTEKQWRSVMKNLLEEGDSCRNITNILLPKSFQNDDKASLERLIEKCPLLEMLEVWTFFNPSVLQNCKRLKEVTNEFSGKKEYGYVRNEPVDALAHLQNLKKFSIFQSRKSSSYYLLIAKMLQNHPKLVSLGYTDSSWAAHHIYTTCKMGTVPRFGLKECFWGLNHYVNRFNRRKQIAYTQQYSEFVKSSVALFPLVEKLNIVVYHKNCIEHLKKLRHLCVLNINFNLCRGSPTRTAFISLLSEIGPQLKCLSIMVRSTMPVDVIMKYCPNVVHLDLCCIAVVQGGIKADSKTFRQLKRLRAVVVDEESLKYLLRYSVNLKELLLHDAICLDDTLLHKILKMKSLSKIDTLAVWECRLSREGLKELIQKCVNLENVAFKNLKADLTTVAEELKRDITAPFSYLERILAI